MNLAKKIAGIKPSVTLAVTSQAKQMAGRGIRVINFAAGEPDFNTPLHVRTAAIQAINNGFTKYTPVSGARELKAAICDKLRRDNALNYQTEQIVVSCGAKHSLFNILQVLCQKGDQVIIASPYWVSYPQMVKLAGARPIIIPTKINNQFKMTGKQLASSITSRTRAVILNSPANPTGSVYNREELAEIARVVLRHNIYLISDEIYEKIIYDKKRHISIASLNKKVNKITIVVNGLSKAYSMTGWRIGYLAGPKELASAVAVLQSHSTSNPNSIAQKAALTALNGKEEFIVKMQKEFSKRRNYLLKEIRKIDKISFSKPEGAFYLFCDISKTGRGSLNFSQKLLEREKVAVVPGVAFGEDNYIRLSFATGMEDIKEGVNRLAKFISRIRP
ncbi:MAG: pyridoxal phosphate-dependent aminotransferase [Candidatus Omnitrophota bacterium]|nr:pyridoxal phosphate-dependent aminotransferase [Candidatus Omnitrophota bacterium]